MRPSRVGLLLAAAALASSPVLVLPAPIRAAEGDLAILSGVDDYILQGQTLRYKDDEIPVYANGSGPHHLLVAAGPYRLDLSLPEGQTWEQRTYVDDGSNLPGTGDVFLHGDGRACNGTVGRFVIIEGPDITSEGRVTKLAVDVEQSCANNRLAVAHASFRIGSTVPIHQLRVGPVSRLPDTTVGHTSAPATFSVENVGTGSASLGPAAVTGPNASDFALVDDDCGGTTLAPAASCTVEATFAPTDTLRREGLLRVPYEGPLASRSVGIWGAGTSPLLLLPVAAEVSSVGNDPVGSNGTWAYPQGQLQLDSITTRSLRMRIPGEWTFAFAAPIGSTLKPGYYWNATPWSETQPHIEVASGATVDPCSSRSGWFRVLEGPVYEKDGTLLSVSVDFAQVCNNLGVLRGALRYHSSKAASVDRTAPTATAPRAALGPGALATGKVPVTLSWSGSDNASGVARYALLESIDGGAWSYVSRSLSAPTTTRLASLGRSYRYAVRAVDGSGNYGAWQYGTAVTVKGFTEGHGATRYTGTWGTASSSAYWGGRVRYATSSLARATFTFTGRSVGLVTTMSSARGKAAIYVNGAYLKTIDLYSATWRNGVVAWSQSWSTAATRTVEIRVLGTTGRPRVDLDGWVVGS